MGYICFLVHADHSEHKNWTEVHDSVFQQMRELYL